ncbi:hypothetical protein GCM10027277_40010 [Pseudoduganella ginsengisoli]
MTPPNEVVQLILRDEPDDVAHVRECMVEKGLRKKYAAKLFTATSLHLNGDGIPDYFVRPSLEPYCAAFYGAHLFRYWFVVGHRNHGKISYHIIFKSGSDEARVLATMTNGYHDLELMGHTASTARVSSWRFNGKEYKPSRCIDQVMGENGWTGSTPCPVDE